MNPPQNMNIILTIPTLPEDEFILVHTSSPIKQFACAKSIEDVSRDYRSLFEECRRVNEDEGSSGLVERDDGIANLSNLKRRRLNMGEKVRGKLQSTNNKSDSMGKPVSTFSSTSSQGQQSLHSHLSKNQQLHPDNLKFTETLTSSFYSLRRVSYASESCNKNQSLDHSRNIQIHPFQYEEEIKTEKNQKEIEINCHNKQFEEEVSQIPLEESSRNSSPYNYFSAKTQSPSFDRKEGSPIQKLKDSNDSEVPSSKIKLLNFNDDSELPKESQSEHDCRVPVIRVSEPQDELDQPDEFVQSLQIVHSRVIDRPYFGNIENIQSRCISCEESMPSFHNSYQHALYQLNLLKQNVTNLETSANNLIFLKKSSQKNENFSSQIPSSIQKQENPNKLDQSFILQLENNFKDIFETERKENEADSLLIGDDSRTIQEFEIQHLEKQHIYRTPHHYGNSEELSFQPNKVLSQRVSNQCKEREIDLGKNNVARALAKTKEYSDLHGLLAKENSPAAL